VDFEAYRRKHFVDPPPEPRFALAGLFDVSLFIQPYEEAVAYYNRVLGEPAYVEGDNTRGWRIGGQWLTLLAAREGAPKNVEITLLANSSEEAERLQRALIDAGGSGEQPFDDLMYEPLRIFPVKDPFGTAYMVIARLEGE
jgi:hypothetical protein